MLPVLEADDNNAILETYIEGAGGEVLTEYTVSGLLFTTTPPPATN